MRLAGDAAENKTRLEPRCEVGRFSTRLFPDPNFQVISARSWHFSETNPRLASDECSIMSSLETTPIKFGYLCIVQNVCDSRNCRIRLWWILMPSPRKPSENRSGR